MRVWIDQDCCTGAGLCVDRCPDLFIVLEDGIGYVRDGDVVFTDPGHASVIVPSRHELDAIDAAEHCPGECIYLEAEARRAPEDRTPTSVTTDVMPTSRTPTSSSNRPDDRTLDHYRPRARTRWVATAEHCASIATTADSNARADQPVGSSTCSIGARR